MHPLEGADQRYSCHLLIRMKVIRSFILERRRICNETQKTECVLGLTTGIPDRFVIQG